MAETVMSEMAESKKNMGGMAGSKKGAKSMSMAKGKAGFKSMAKHKGKSGMKFGKH